MRGRLPGGTIQRRLPLGNDSLKIQFTRLREIGTLILDMVDVQQPRPLAATRRGFDQGFHFGFGMCLKHLDELWDELRELNADAIFALSRFDQKEGEELKLAYQRYEQLERDFWKQENA